MTAIEAIIKAKFVATETQVTQLAAIVATGVQAAGTYLRVLVVHTQSELSKRRKPKAKVQIATLDAVHARFYPCVLKGVGPDDLDAPERNRRATFARSAASTLRYFISAGGDMRALEVDNVSKAALRKVGRPVPKGTRTERALTRASESVISTIQRIAKSNPNAARQRVEALQAHLEELLEEIAELPQPEKRRGRPAKKASRKSGGARITNTRGLQRVPRPQPSQPAA